MSTKRFTAVLKITVFSLVIFSMAAVSGYAASSKDSDCCRLTRDVQEIQNVMSRHAWYYSSGQHKREFYELFAYDMPDVSWGNGSEWWVGKDLFYEYYVEYFDQFRMRDLKAFAEKHPEVEIKPENLGAGSSMFHTNSTPVIEVAGDGKTAQGIWYSIGQVTQTPGGQQTPTYMWERYGVDFIKVDGQWKIWHFMVLTDWSASPGSSWAEDDRQGGFGGAPGGGQAPPDGQGAPPQGGMPGGHGNDAAQMGGQAGESASAPSANVSVQQERKGAYAPPSETLFIPVPYQTFSETESYGPPK